MKRKTQQNPILQSIRFFSVLLSFFLLVGLGNVVNAQVTAITKSTTDVFSTQITSVTVGGVNVDCVKDADCKLQFAHFMYNSSTRVVVKAAATITSHSIHPVGRGIQGTVSGNTLTFDIAPVANKATYLLVKINGYDPLVILGDKPETNVPIPNGSSIVDITKPPYSAANDYSLNVTSKIQKAIDDMSSRSGGGTVCFPKGTYKIFEELEMKSNVAIYLAPGAHIESDPTKTYTSGNFTYPLIWLRGQKNVKFYGRGTLNAKGMKIMDPKSDSERRGVIKGSENYATQSSNVVIDGIVLRDGTTWTCDIKYADGVNISNVKVLNHWDQNYILKIQNDGINLCSSKNGNVWNNLVITGDDAFCVKAQDEVDGGTRKCYNIRNHDNVIFNMGAANKIGMNAKAEIYDVTFDNNEVIACRRGVVVESKISGNSDANYHPLHDITFSNILIENYQGYAGFTQRIFEFWASRSAIRNITVTNVESLKVPISGGDAYCDGSNKIDRLTFNCLKIAGKEITQSNYAANGLDFTPCVSNVTFNTGCIPVPIPVTSVNVSPSSLTLKVGQTSQLTATVLPTNATNKTVTWTSSNTTVATVNASGLVTAIKAGSATITVKTNDGGFTATCAVTVTDDIPVTGVGVSPSSLSLSKGATGQLTANVLPVNATNKTVTWKSSNTTVATVNTSGLVTAIKAGSATITVTTNDGGFTATCAVTVTDDIISVTGVGVSPSSLSLSKDSTGQLTANVLPANATNKTVTWKSSNTTVATVNTSGLVTAINAGSATITVTTNDGGFTDTCAVTVTSDPISILDIEAEKASSQSKFSPFVVVNDPSASGGQYIVNTISTTTIDENNGGLANYFFILSGTATITFSVNANFPGGSDDSFFYRIDNGPWQVQNGPTTAGWQTIAITSFTDLSPANTHTLTILRREDGAKIDKITLSNTSNVTISEPSDIVNVTSINLPTTTLALEAGKTSQLTANVLPTNATDKTVTWLTNNSDVATVDANGLVTAISVGSATITVKTNDGEFIDICTVTVSKIDDNLYEAELAAFTNSSVKAGGTGQYVDIEAGGKITWNINSTSNTTSKLTFSISSLSDNRSMGVYVNNVKKGVISTSLSAFSNKTVIANLNAGSNVIELRDSEGTRELDVDYVSVENITTTKLTLSYNNVATSGWANPEYSVDGDDLTPATKSGSTAAYIEYNLGGTYMLTSARINEDNVGNWQLDSWKLQYYNGSTWVDAFAYTNSTTAGWNEVAINGVETDKIRVYLKEDSYIEVFEVEVYGAVVTSKSAMIETKQQNISVGSSTNVYPNPIKDELNVVCNGNENIISVALFDVTGKKLNVSTKNSINVQMNTLNTSGISRGTYFLQVVTQCEGTEKSQVFKVIK